MAFVVKATVLDEDGNSYAAVDTTDAYFADRPNAAWTAATSGQKQTALIAATDYISGRWAAAFTDDVKESLTIPVGLTKAVAEYAVRALSAPLIPDPVVGDNGLGQVLKRKKTGPLEKEWETVGNASRPSMYRSYPSADILMVPLVKIATDRVIR